jgi:hypothetical protein
MAYDVIGDIHGQAGKLHAVLRRLGYTRRASGWRPPPGRQAVVVGDLIDRGPEQLAVLDTVRRMVDAGDALAVLGNHEFNAIGYATPKPDEPGAFLRPHTPGNQRQHAAFLHQVGECTAQHRAWVHWFRTLRPAMDLGGIRVVHAWWHAPHIQTVDAAWPQGRPMPDHFLHAAFDRTQPAWAAMEGLTKGLELRLPPGHSFVDHGGVERFDVRARWWLPAPQSLQDVAIVDEVQRQRVPAAPLPADYPAAAIEGAPVFMGHYWLTGQPVLQAPRVACLDYSAANDGPLVAYRWDGEADLDPAGFVAAGG